MGNTKLIYFSGNTTTIPTDKQVMEVVKGEYATVKAEPGGYLQQDWADPSKPHKDADPNTYFLIGAAHTHSANFQVDKIGKFLNKWGEVLVCDLDWTDCKVYYYEEGNRIHYQKYNPVKDEN